KALVSGQLNEWISDALTEDELPRIAIPNDMSHYLKRPVIRQFLMDNLINVRKNVTGDVVTSLVELYKTLGLKEDSIRKLNSLAWHKRARGIYELYMMQQKEELQDILEYTNSNNEFVRMEAQTAIIGFSGFNGLVFLDQLTYPLYEWQQIKLLEQLNTVNTGEMSHLPLWLGSANPYVVQFALKLAEIYQQFQVHDEVVPCLESKNDKIRNQAIRTLGSIASEDTIEIFKQHYGKETVLNKKAILEQFVVNGDKAELEFLYDKLDEEDDSLKLESVRAIAAIDKNAFSELEIINAGNNTLISIIKQVKHENVA
ncbi:MAG: HEAT repeat domain-containing protein, partial [Flavipsychrobacter sp.]